LFSIRRISHRWAGLRTFAPDKTPVVGPDSGSEGFFWLAGQGGYGIQTAPAMARTAAGLLTSGKIPEDLAALGVGAEDLAPGRLRAN
jgi:D-arginine dehydrogenase